MEYPDQNHLLEIDLCNKIRGHRSHKLPKFILYSKLKGLISIHCCHVFLSLSFVSSYSLIPCLYSPLAFPVLVLLSVKGFYVPLLQCCVWFQFSPFFLLLCMFFFLPLMSAWDSSVVLTTLSGWLHTPRMSIHHPGGEKLKLHDGQISSCKNNAAAGFSAVEVCGFQLR